VTARGLTGVAIRAARPSDREALVRLLVAQLRDHAVATATPEIERGVDGLLAQPALGRFLVAERAGEVVGLAALSFLWTLEHGGRAAWLDELYVEPSLREGGIGTALARAAIELARAEGALAMDLEIEQGHERVATLYRREGFRAHARTRYVKRLAGDGA
jgi:GNAT superfamily N-acetyltransferase